MDFNSIGGATPFNPVPQTPQTGRAPVAPVSRETLAPDAGVSREESGGGQPVSTPVVGKEEANASRWQREGGARGERQENAVGGASRQDRAERPAGFSASGQAEEARDASQPPTPQEAQEAARQARQSLQKGVNDINKFVQTFNKDINFSVDEDTGRLVVKVVDKETKEVIKQIPSEEALRLADSLEKLQGLLIRQQA